MLAIARVAYDLKTPVQFSALWRAIELRRRLDRRVAEFGKPISFFSQRELDKLAAYRESEIASLRSAKPTDSSLTSRINGEVELTNETLEEVLWLSPPAYSLYQSDFWTSCSQLPAPPTEYLAQIHRFSHFVSSRREQEYLFHGFYSSDERPPPHQLIVAASRRDNLEAIMLFVLLCSAAMHFKWHAVRNTSFECLLRKLGRLSVVSPFDFVGAEFAAWILGSLDTGREWLERYEFRREISRKFISWAADNDLCFIHESDFGDGVIDRDEARILLLTFESQFQERIDNNDERLLNGLESGKLLSKRMLSRFYRALDQSKLSVARQIL